ncbi:PHP domain-containing protein [Pseudodesulfovibrio sp.]|uniref:PHP domain-containing protein n=1 Tax=unclassified Pseudodesulfovibrio TaxID=2661612 RepID=UPI003AFF73CA
MLIDLHVHSTISSCSSLPVGEILGNARSRGLDGVCITDHDSISVLSQIREGFQPDGLLVLVGMEYATPQGDFLVFGPVDRLTPGLDGASLLREVDSLGGAAVAAHPFRSWRSSDVAVVELGPCLVEVENGRNTDAENRQAAELADRLGAHAVAGSDAHTLAELGRRPTRFHTRISCRADLVHALRLGQCLPFHMAEAVAS